MAFHSSENKIVLSWVNDSLEVVGCRRNCLWSIITVDYVTLHVRKPHSELGNYQFDWREYKGVKCTLWFNSTKHTL
jgi:hypothetical protein